MPRPRIYPTNAERQKAYRKRLKRSVCFSSRTDLWATPQDLFAELDREFHFTLDVCALPENAKCTAFYSPDQDGLAQPWSGVCWMNPPYGREIALWIAKAYIESQAGATVVALLPSRTDTAWWHNYVLKAAERRPWRGRIRFNGTKRSERGAPFASTIVVFKPNGNASY